MSTIWFTADPHWGHDWVAGLRGFDDVRAYDEALLDKFRSVITKRDIVYWLGDMTMGSPEVAIKWTKEIPAQSHRLILGNHDRGHPLFKDSARWLKRYWEAFDYVGTVGHVKVGRHRVLLSHFPYTGEGDPTMTDRHVQWRLRDEGSPLLHGHTHSDQTLGFSSKATPMLHVGLDAWGMSPVHVSTVEMWLDMHFPS